MVFSFFFILVILFQTVEWNSGNQVADQHDTPTNTEELSHPIITLANIE
jgi:hypothetical protein